MQEPKETGAGRDYDSMIDDLRRYVTALEWQLARGKAAGRDNGDAAVAAVAGLSSALEELRAARDELADARRDAEVERARYKDLFAAAPDGYLITGPHGNVTEANVAAADLLHVHRPYLLGKPLYVFMANESKDAYWSAIRLARNEGRLVTVLRMVPRGRVPVAVQATVTSVQSEAPRVPDELRWILRDVTAERAAAEELEAYRRRLRGLTAELAAAEERERRRIAVGIHDRVSQPLAAARMLLGRLREACGAEDAASRQRAVRHLAELLQVLDVAIGESRTLTFELSPPVLYELGLRQALTWLADEVARRTGLKIGIRADVTGLPIEPRVFLYQAARELLTNVAKHAGARAATISVRRQDGSVQLSVNDDGAGFDREHDARPDPRRGGFGLFSLRTRVEQSGGKFEIRSSRRGGTRVTVSIPVAD